MNVINSLARLIQEEEAEVNRLQKEIDKLEGERLGKSKTKEGHYLLKRISMKEHDRCMHSYALNTLVKLRLESKAYP